MPSISELLNNMTNRLVFMTVVIYFILEALFAGARSGLELFSWMNPEFQLWQIVSYQFLHGSLTHLAFNMIALWSFGRVLERVWGSQRFLIFYLLCGIGAALIHLAIGYFEFELLAKRMIEAGYSETQLERLLLTGQVPSSIAANIGHDTLREFYTLYHAPTVGASGAVYGILVAFALLFPEFRVALIFLPIPIAAKYFVPVLLLIDLIAGLFGISIFGQNIAHFAHIGGAIIGFLLVMCWRKNI